MEILVQSCYLTRCTREKDLAAFVKKTLYILVCIFYASLYIFGTHESFYALHIFRIVNDYLPILIETSAKYNSSFVDGFLGKDVKYTS